jgi:hypothetical protein
MKINDIFIPFLEKYGFVKNLKEKEIVISDL